MSTSSQQENPKHHAGESTVIGVFDSIDSTKKALQALHKRGYSADQINVIGKEELVAQHFPEYQPQAGPESWKAAALFGASAGGAVGGVVSLAALTAGAAVPVLVAGGMAGMLTGGIVGSLAGLMTERGLEPQAVDYYVVAVEDGHWLIAVELEGKNEKANSQTAEILQAAGSEPIQISGNGSS